MKVSVGIPNDIQDYLRNEKGLNDEQIIHLFIMWMQDTVFDYGWASPKYQIENWIENFGQDYVDEMLADEPDVPMKYLTEIKFQ